MDTWHPLPITAISGPTFEMTPLSAPHISHTSRQTDIAALFDVDNTLLPGQASEVRFFRFLWKRGLVGWREVRNSIEWVLRCAPPVSLHPLRERKLYLAGKGAAEVEALAEEFCRTELCPRLSAQGLSRMDEHRRAGHHIVLVTGSLDFLIAPLASLLEVPTLLAARLEQQEQQFTGHVCAPLPYGPGKRELIARLTRDSGIDLAQSFAYGDSPGDVELLEMVGHPLVVNPIRGMDRIAQRNGWPMTTWT
ncbi:MAG: HAD-IB family hydrolase [Nitrospira sp.]